MVLKHTPLFGNVVWITCDGCGHVGPLPIPIPVTVLCCLACGLERPTPYDFWKHDATLLEVAERSERARRLQETLANVE